MAFDQDIQVDMNSVPFVAHGVAVVEHLHRLSRIVDPVHICPRRIYTQRIRQKPMVTGPAMVPQGWRPWWSGGRLTLLEAWR